MRPGLLPSIVLLCNSLVFPSGIFFSEGKNEYTVPFFLSKPKMNIYIHFNCLLACDVRTISKSVLHASKS